MISRRELIHSEDLQTRITAAWADLCDHLAAKANEIGTKGNSVCAAWVPRNLCHLASDVLKIIPEVEYRDIIKGLDRTAIQDIKASGTVVVRGVVPEEKVCLAPSIWSLESWLTTLLQALEWLASIKEYIARNPQVKGFPENDKAVYEL
jgi:hypothetical protein